MFLRGNRTLVFLSLLSACTLLAGGAALTGCTPSQPPGSVPPIPVPSNEHLVLLATAPISIPNDLLQDGQLYFVDDTTAKVVAVVPFRKGMNVTVSNLTPGRKYRLYLVPTPP